MTDAFFAAKAALGSIDLSLVGLVNTASAYNDSPAGSVISMTDAFFIAKRALGSLNDLYQVP